MALGQSIDTLNGIHAAPVRVSFDPDRPTFDLALEDAERLIQLLYAKHRPVFGALMLEVFGIESIGRRRKSA